MISEDRWLSSLQWTYADADELRLTLYMYTYTSNTQFCSIYNLIPILFLLYDSLFGSAMLANTYSIKKLQC